MEEFLTNNDLLEIWKSYDAYYFANKYLEETTHKKEFKNLRESLKFDEMSYRALNWISQCYDSYYKNEYENKDDSNPFYYLQCKINELNIINEKERRN